MRFPKKCKIERVCAKDASRPRLTAPVLNVKRGLLEATNSYAAVRVPVIVEDGDTDGAVPQEALAAARAKAPRKDHEASLSLNGDAEVKGFAIFRRNDPGGNWPDFDKLMPKKKDKPVVQFGINAAILADAAAALGADSVKVSVYGPLQAMLIEPLGGDGQGVVMPVRLAS